MGHSEPVWTAVRLFPGADRVTDWGGPNAEELVPLLARYAGS